jgi:hypothetical protein
MFIRQNKRSWPKRWRTVIVYRGTTTSNGDNQDKLDVFGANRRAIEEIARR